MKKILHAAVAALASVSMTGMAIAATHQTTNQRHYAGTAFGGYTITNPQPVTIPFLGTINPGQIAGELGVATGYGTRYTATTSAPDDTETATPTVSAAFTLTGSVNKDCSLYVGNNAAARNIDFGVIGVRTGDNENVNSAFEMAGDLNATVQSLTAGCNFNNEVTIAKGNQYGDGMNLVGNPGGFDSSQFQTNIPYKVSASWTGVPLNYIGSGSPQSLNVGIAQASNSLQQGAWRSQMTIGINAPAITGRGLVAGTYQDTMTVTLSAL